MTAEAGGCIERQSSCSRDQSSVGGDMTPSDLAEIEALVSKLTGEPIVQITVRGPGLAEVKTGVVLGRRDGGGSIVNFEK